MDGLAAPGSGRCSVSGAAVVPPPCRVTGGGLVAAAGALDHRLSGQPSRCRTISAVGGCRRHRNLRRPDRCLRRGGAVRLVATAVTGTGTIDVSGASGASAGRIRVEAFTNTATVSGGVPGGVSVGVPDALALTVVGLRIAAIGGVPAPIRPGGSYATPDVVLPAGTTSPVTVALEATQVPPGTTVVVTATPLSGAPVSVISTPLVGTPAAASATATLAIPTAQPSVISATASFTIPAAP